ncbi:hypothetical protein GYMLUDRAFT_64553 [Collybiopsis luxurians FD-317 M1]|uniref:Uncharacterized protein n=1 Tax=Collybiopsis luxurians FD-317 M1 TaxID=944289 RepID=A0A0D0BC41_9AGAR|nr:hypothetical protein GYMLUDRAFT_64553 [Collybiopsis luxurians FD-317 M1]
MENSIGNLTKAIKPDVQPYMNLSEKAAVRAQVNALKENHIPETARDLGDNYILLHPTAQTSQILDERESAALARYLEEENIPTAHVVHWAHLCLPNGQITHLFWQEHRKTENVWMACNVKTQADADMKPEFNEVQFYFQFSRDIDNNTTPLEILAMVSRYSEADQNLCKQSFGTVILCKYQAYQVSGSYGAAFGIIYC